MSGPLDNKRRGKGMFLALEPRILLDAAAAVLAGDLIQEALTADSDAGTVERAQVEPTADAEDATTDSPETQADTYDTADSADAAASPLDAAAEVHPLDIVPAADGSADARHEIAFVDASVPEADSLVSGLPDRVEVYRIDAGSSGIARSPKSSTPGRISTPCISSAMVLRVPSGSAATHSAQIP
ncbi:LEPR-XLL domain-containing protein [Chlorobium phaeovibrioides]|uniref:LEPR-XLL domain-containing protein n=1 Tax=Chlorobium phaeovibrioides TaxID=1094 RepID=UPI001230671B|nr:LEPR-XLL domain-containing protein [Chlorobium phaeovibrioides]QEQ57396.1 LEPR-XLL domain-containing protein [Chlorobium phaeovibrioides]